MLSYCSKCEKETYNVCAKKTSYDDDYQDVLNALHINLFLIK